MSAGRFASTVLSILVAGIVIVPLSAWAALALWFRLPAPDWARAAIAGLFATVGLLTVIGLFAHRRRIALAVFAIAFGGVILWWSTVRPPADGDWAPDVARQTTGSLNGDILTLTDVRDFDWRSDNDFTERWGKQTYDLGRLKSLDLFLAYWSGPHIAHLIMSFGFDNREKLAWSVEVRREKKSEYSPLADAFKSHTLVYLATTERDSVRLRSNVRGEDVRLYRLRTPAEAARTLLLQYVAEANALAEAPAFYNTITTNCTTAVVKLIRAAGGVLPFDWRLILNGHLPGYLYDQGAVVTTIPLQELIERARIDDRAMASDPSSDFSALIRVGVPTPWDEIRRP